MGENFMIFYKYDTEYAIIKNKISILLRQGDLHESKSDGSGVVSCDHNVAVFCKAAIKIFQQMTGQQP